MTSFLFIGPTGHCYRVLHVWVVITYMSGYYHHAEKYGTLKNNYYLFSFGCAGSSCGMGFSLAVSGWGLLSSCGACVFHRGIFSSCRTQAPGRSGFSRCSPWKLNSYGSQALGTGSVVVANGPRIAPWRAGVFPHQVKPRCPELTDGLFTTEPGSSH